MRLALVTGPCPPGKCGVGDYTHQLANALRSLGVRTELVSEGGWGVIDAAKAIRSLDKLKPDMVHIQYPTAGFGYGLGPQLFAMRKKTVITLHEASQAHTLRKLALYPFTVRAQHLIFTSQYERQFATRWAPWITRISSVIPIGSNIEAAPDSPNRRHDEVTYFGLIMPKKGLDEVLQLARSIQRAGSALQVRIIGKAHSKHEAYFSQLRLQSASLPVIWESELSDQDVAARLANCAVAYLPFPDGASERRASLKAMLASGVAVVTTRGVHTPRDLEGIVKFSENVENAYGVIRMLVENRSEREKLGRKAAEYMRQFGWDHIAALHLRVYENILRWKACDQASDCRENKSLPC